MSGMDLVRFLFERIAEDEAAARRAHGARVPPGLFGPGRVLADCAAKRGIVELQRADLMDDPDDWRADEILRLLALPYADHPAYQPEWRP